MWKFIKYELHYWMKSPLTWILLAVNTLLIFGATSSENITIGGSVGSVHKNAPYVIQSMYGFMSLICLLMTTSFMTATALRDYQSNMQQIVFSSPIRKHEYLLGKYIGATLMALIPLLGVSFGFIIGSMMPWVQAETLGPLMLNGHVLGFVGFAIPNVIFMSSIIYSIAIFSKNQIGPFLSALGLLVLYIVSGTLLENLDNQWVSIFSDPFGLAPFSATSRYYTVADKNIHGVALSGDFLINRILWIAISFIILFFVYKKFSFFTRESKKQKEESKHKETLPPILPQPNFKRSLTNQYDIKQLIAISIFEIKGIVKNPTFIIIGIFGLMNIVGNITSFEGQFGTNNYPVTYDIVERIQNSYSLFIIAIIIFYAGNLVWRDRETKMNEIKDATPTSNATFYLSKIIALFIALFLLQFIAMLFGIAIQLMHGYTRLELDLYAKTLLGIDLLMYYFAAVISIFFHYLINNRFIAYFAMIVFNICNIFLWNAMKVDTLLVKYGRLPSVTYSDMNRFSPFVKNVTWYAIYWSLGAAIIAFVTYLFYIRGKENNFTLRLAEAKKTFLEKKFIIIPLLLSFTICCSFIYYNTRVLNEYTSSKKGEENQVAYELKYKKYEGAIQPEYQHLEYKIDLRPENAEGIIDIVANMKNVSNKPIQEIYISEPEMNDSLSIEIPNSSLTLSDSKIGFRIYKLKSPMLPNDSFQMHITNYILRNGFTDESERLSFAHNGTFFSTESILPLLGYDERLEMENKFKRIEYKLPPKELAPTLDSSDMIHCKQMYFGTNASYVTTNTVISTSPKQTAIAPGSLLRTWDSAGRRYFNYQLDHPSVNFYSFLSAEYHIQKKLHKGVSLEVYYHPSHDANVPNALKSLEKSLDYYVENFGPYYHKQMRIIEFPRYASFAQSFPGTMPYSENIGFINDLRKVDDDVIDGLFYVVAHEVGHQWWAHQLIGANMKGSVMLAESFSQYSALMVMEKAYGKDKMKKFLKYELDDYLQGRGSELRGEVPLAQTSTQSHVYYQKGSLALYYLKEMIGEKNVNLAMQSLIETYAYKGSPYPTSLHALEAFHKVTPDSLQYLIQDLFQDIILFDNRIVSCESKKIGNQYQVTLKTFSEKLRSDSLGKETKLPLRDYIDIGIFAKSESKINMGKELIKKRVLITKRDNTFSYMLANEPYKVGIDPYNYLIDRIPDDNVKKIE